MPASLRVHAVVALLAAVPAGPGDGSPSLAREHGITRHASSTPRQDSKPTAAGEREFSNGRYRLRMPAGWRQLTPDEARQVRALLPGDMRDLPVPFEFDRLGNIDSWLAGRFDGRCVTIGMREGEAPLQEEDAALATIRASLVKRHEGTGLDYTWLGGGRTAIGPGKHPAFEASIGIRPKGEGRPMKTVEIYVPTGGYTVTIQCRAFAGDFDDALPVFRRIIDTLEFAREPTGPDELTDRLQFAAIVGAIVGLILLVLYKWTRR